MKISANAGELATALALAASLSSHKAKSIAALEAVRIKTADGALTITANVLDFSLTQSLPAEIEEPGELAVSGARLAALTAGFSDTTTIEIASEGAIAHIGSGRSRFKLPTTPLADLPPVPTLVGETGSVALAREEAAALLVRPAFAASTEPTRYYLGGVLLHSDGDGLSAVATDSQRLVRIHLSGAAGLSSDFGLIVPNSALRIIARLLTDRGVECVTLRRSKTLFALETAKAVFVSKLIDARFPDYTRLIPGRSGNAVTVERAELVRAFDRVAAVAEDQKRYRIVGLIWSEGEPELRLCLVGSDAADDVIAAEVVGSGRTAVQIGHLAEMLAALEGERVCLDSRSAGDPILVTDPHDESFSSLVMPCAWQPVSRAA